MVECIVQTAHLLLQVIQLGSLRIGVGCRSEVALLLLL